MGVERQRRRAQKVEQRAHSNATSKPTKNASSFAAFAIIAIVLVAAFVLATYGKRESNNEATRNAPEVLKDSDIESEADLLDDNELEEKFASVMKDIDKKLLPSEPYEDFISEPDDFNNEKDEAPPSSFPSSGSQDSSGLTSQAPELKRINWWPDVERKLTEVPHERLHVNPDVYVLPNLLSNAECYELIKLYEEMSKGRREHPDWCFRDQNWLETELRKGNVDTRQIQYSNSQEGDVCVSGRFFGDVLENKRKLRYSSTVLVPRGENSLVDRIEEKLQERLGLPLVTSYHAQLIKYRGNEEYRPHTDCHDDHNDRVGTVIIYLNNVKEGGHTEFTRLRNVSVQPKRGLGLLWNSLDKRGACNRKTQHASGVLKDGVKYIFQRWFHQDQMVPSYDSEVILCDNSRSCREYIYSANTRTATEKMTKAEQRVSQKNLREALTLYQQAIEIQPNHSMSLIYGADVLARMGRKPEALHWFKRALKLHPKHVDSNFIAATILQDEGKLPQAAELLRTVVEEAPKDGDAFFNLGIMLAEMEKYEESAKMLKRVTELKPDDAEAHGELGSVLADLGRETEAEEYYKRAKEIMRKTKRRRQ